MKQTNNKLSTVVEQLFIYCVSVCKSILKSIR